MKRELSYLSPAFRKRSCEDAAYLKAIDGRTGFALFWVDFVEPLLQLAKPGVLLEVGADRGQHTEHLIRFAEETRSQLHVVEPHPQDVLREMIEQSTSTAIYEGLSQDILPDFSFSPDAAIIEGDLNFVSMLSDLESLQLLCDKHGQDFPLTFVASTSWPYARRDMYYDPDHIARDDRHPFDWAGMSPWSRELMPGMINHPFCNAAGEGGPRNGVLTAIETFLRSRDDLSLFTIPANHGVGVIYRDGSNVADFLDDRFVCGQGLRDLMETIELARINETLRRIRLGKRSLIQRVIGRLRRTVGLREENRT